MKATKLITGLLLCLTIALAGCSLNPLAGGGGSDLGNGVIVGYALAPDGSPVENVRVSLASSDYDPVKRTGLSSMRIGFTDVHGRYSFKVNVQTTYTIEAMNRNDNTRFLLNGIEVTKDSTTYAPNGRLAKPGSIKVTLPDFFDFADGYVYLPGTNSYAMPIEDMDYIVFDSVPAGVVPSIKSSARNSNIDRTIRYDVNVSSGDTTVVTMPLWSYSTTMVLNTSSSGADVAGTVTDFPVLVRLTKVNFNFEEAKGDGSDLFFAKTDGQSLPYEIEQWDSTSGQATIWVKVDTIYGNNNTQSITMYWGNDRATSQSAGSGVFSSAGNFAGVWHLGNNPASSLILDATEFGANGSPLGGMTSASSVPGNTGGALRFDGIDDYITVSVQGVAAIDSRVTISFWVKVELSDHNYRAVFTMSGDSLKRKLLVHIPWKNDSVYFDAGWPFPFDERITNYCDPSFFNDTWSHWAFVKDTSTGLMQIYRNGSLWLNSPNHKTAFGGITGFLLGADPAYSGYLDSTRLGICSFFKGAIDEFEVSTIARNRDWIKLEYMNRKQNNELIFGY